jgi:hypothetical protein
MVGEHYETEKFTTMVRKPSHECRWTRPQKEGERASSAKRADRMENFHRFLRAADKNPSS